MERTTTPLRIPDAINCTASSNFTQVPNEILRNPSLSPKAKGILCLLLSNKNGWHSHVAAITKMMNAGERAIRTGLSELEEHGLLMRLKYRDKSTKKYRGVLWCYTDQPGEYNLEEKEILGILDKHELELYDGSTSGFSERGFSERGKRSTNNTNRKNINNNKKNMVKSQNSENSGHITSAMFDKFWKLYPRKVDKGKAKTKWEQICSKPTKERPTWKEVKSAIRSQRESERWQEIKYIPHPTTWLNQQRWLDDPAEMKPRGGKPSEHPKETPQEDPHTLIKSEFKDPDTIRVFTENCYKPFEPLFNGVNKSVMTQALINLYLDVSAQQQRNLPNNLRGLLPGPFDVIRGYAEWLEGNSWVTDISVKLLSVDHTLFHKFRRHEATKDNSERDPLTGKSYMRG